MSDSRSPAIYLRDNPGKTSGARFRNIRWTKDMKKLSEDGSSNTGNVTQNTTEGTSNGNGEVTTDAIRTFFDKP